MESDALGDHELEGRICHAFGPLDQGEEALVAVDELALLHVRDNLLAGHLCTFLGLAKNQYSFVLAISPYNLRQFVIQYFLKSIRIVG